MITGVGVVVVLLLGVALYALMRFVRGRVRALALSKPRRALLDRLRPLSEALASIIYVVVSVRILFGDEELYSTIVLGALILAFLFMGYPAIRDVLAGLLLKAGELCATGDYIEVDGVGGRVRSLGYRVIALDTPDGGQAFVPYSRVTRKTLIRRPVTDGIFQHSFRLSFDPDKDVVERKELVRRCALNSHWHSVVQEPQIEVNDDGSFTVTVVAIAPNQGHRIEKQVREALAR